MQTRTVYSYDAVTGEYLGETISHENPRRPGTYLLPAHSTESAPPAVGAQAAAIFRGGAWAIAPDWRGHAYWLADGSRHEIAALGVEPPAEALDEPPLPPLADAQAQRIAAIKREAHSLLSPYDWYWTRKLRTGEDVPAEVATYYAAVTAASDQAEAEIAVLTDATAVLAYRAPSPEPPGV